MFWKSWFSCKLKKTFNVCTFHKRKDYFMIVPLNIRINELFFKDSTSKGRAIPYISLFHCLFWLNCLKIRMGLVIDVIIFLDCAYHEYGREGFTFPHLPFFNIHLSRQMIIFFRKSRVLSCLINRASILYSFLDYMLECNSNIQPISQVHQFDYNNDKFYFQFFIV